MDVRFHFSGYILRSGIARTDDNSMFNILKYCQFPKAAAPFSLALNEDTNFSTSLTTCIIVYFLFHFFVFGCLNYSIHSACEVVSYWL